MTWTSELAKHIASMPEVRPFLQAPENDEVLLETLVALLAKDHVGGGAETSDPLLGGSTLPWTQTPQVEGVPPFFGLAAPKKVLFGKRPAEAAPSVQPPLKMARAKASAPGPTSAQVERQRQEDGLAQVLAFLGEPSSDQAATAAAFLDQLHQVKSKAGIPEELRRGGLFVLAYTGEKFPADQKTAELEELMNELKAAEVPQEAQQKLELKEKLFLSKLLPAENLAVFVENLVGACTAVPGPKHDQLRAALEQVPSSLRLLLGLPAPGKYSRQKAHGWERDFSRMLALAATGFRAHYDALLCPDSPAEVQEAEEEEEEPEDTLDADVAAALALGP